MEPTPDRFFGVGVVRQDRREAMTEAAQLTAAIIRHFAAGSVVATTFNPLPYLTVADRHTAPLANGDTLHLFFLPWPEPIAVPAGYRAAFSASTRRWKRGAAPLMSALDAYVADFIRLRGWAETEFERHTFTEQNVHFLYIVMLTEAGPSP
jgi:hypothetical protein